MRLRRGEEERGCGYTVKEVRIYVQLQLQGTSCSRRVLRTRPYILRIKAWQRILRDSRHGFTVRGEQPDRSFDIQLQVDAWRCRPAIIRGRVRAQRNSAPKTQSNLLCPGLFCPHRHEVRKALALSILFLVDIQQRCLRTHSWWHAWPLVCTHQKHENPPSIIAVSGSSRCTVNWIFTHSVRHAGLARDRNTNLGALASETMWCPQILIQLLAVLIILQPHIHISTCSSLHCERSARSQFVLKFWKTCFTRSKVCYLVKKRPLDNVCTTFTRSHFYLVKRQP